MSLIKDFSYEAAKHLLSWEGTAADLEIYEILDDDEVLDIVFDKFNLARRPKGYSDTERALSIGDVVSIDFRAYLYDTTGWVKLAKFDLVHNSVRS